MHSAYLQLLRVKLLDGANLRKIARLGCNRWCKIGSPVATNELSTLNTFLLFVFSHDCQDVFSSVLFKSRQVFSVRLLRMIISTFCHISQPKCIHVIEISILQDALQGGNLCCGAHRCPFVFHWGAMRRREQWLFLMLECALWSSKWVVDESWQDLWFCCPCIETCHAWRCSWASGDVPIRFVLDGYLDHLGFWHDDLGF